jgi:hypothetical protein
MNQEGVSEIEIEFQSTMELLIGNDVLNLLSDIDFLNSWNELYNSCSWATVYQGKEFVSTWYQIYYGKYLPIIIKETQVNKLTSLLTLAKDKKGLIVGAGAGQAEYQVWLSKLDGGNFIKKALLTLRKQFPGSDIKFRFIPGKTPLKWVETDLLWKKRCILRTYQQPLMIIDEINISNELKKKNRKNSINRLKRLGDLKFERITDTQNFVSVFDNLAAQFDFRKAVMYNKTPFQNDILKKKFLLALFDQNILHATVLKLNHEIIAANVSSIGKNWMHLQGINTHAPSYAKYSPGILHFLFLADSLTEEGIEIFDLTPGGDSYKEHLATRHVSAYELSIPGNIKSLMKELKEKIFYNLIINKEKILNSLTKIGITAKDIKNTLRKINIAKAKIQKVKEQGFFVFLAELLKDLTQNRKNKIYRITSLLAQNMIPVKKNHLTDLLSYQSKNLQLTKWEFLTNAMQKLEKEQNVYSFREHINLMNCVWLKENKIDSSNRISKQESGLPDGSRILYDFYYYSTAKAHLKPFVTSVLNDISKTGVTCVYAIVNGRNKFLCKAIEEVGFVEVSKE